jgi:putative ABC transport system permease protein
VPQNDVAVRPLAEAFSATKQHPHWPGWVAIRVAGDPDALALSAQRAVRELDPDAVVKTVSMESMMATSLAPHRFTAVLLGTFALLATILAAVGLFGVIAYLVEQRTREIGVRVALGAQKHHVLGLVLREGMTLTTVGLVVGVALSLGFSRLLKSQLYEVAPTDATVIALAALALSAVAIVAAFVPARRATKVDPLISLRAE